MRFASLGSGSKGNATLVEWQGQYLLIDCGFTIKATEARMAKLGVSPSELSAILVTHEHGDHIKGVAPLARKYKLPVYMTPGTYHSKDLGVLPQLHLIEGYQAFEVAGMTVKPIAVPHDAREPAQYILEAADLRLGILTDLGSISPHIEEHYDNCHGLVMEANHDPAMLASGPYPQSLKQRVGGLWGHLSNQQCAGFLGRLNLTMMQHLVVGHISQQNNSLELAQQVMSAVTTPIGQVHYACQEQGFDWLSLTPVQ